MAARRTRPAFLGRCGWARCTRCGQSPLDVESRPHQRVSVARISMSLSPAPQAGTVEGFSGVLQPPGLLWLLWLRVLYQARRHLSFMVPATLLECHHTALSTSPRGNTAALSSDKGITQSWDWY